MKKQKPVKNNWLDRGMIRSLYYTLCLSEKAFRAELVRMKSNEFPQFLYDGGDATTHYLEHEGKMCAIVCLRNPENADDPVVIAGLLVHEAVHIWQKACKVHREFISQDGEFEAYSVQGIAQNLMWEFVRQTGA